MSKRIGSIEGEKFNKLTVISESPEMETRYPSGAIKRYYKCLCECGNYTFVCRQALLSGHTKSCGCAKSESRIEDLSGKKFARLTAITLDEESNKLGLQRLKNGEIKNFTTKWICECECGNKTSVGSYQLKSGHTKSCGCYQSEVISKRNKEISTKIHQFDIGDQYSTVYSENKKDFFIVDNEDLEYILCWFWRKDKKGYWVTNAKIEDDFGKSMLRMHQLIAVRKFGEYNCVKYIPDHLNRDKSDNRRCNLELKTNADNSRNRSLSVVNTSGKTGVSWNSLHNRWFAGICVDYKQIHLGYFEHIDDAISARLEAEQKYGYLCDDIMPKNAPEVIK